MEQQKSARPWVAPVLLNLAREANVLIFLEHVVANVHLVMVEVNVNQVITRQAFFVILYTAEVMAVMKKLLCILLLNIP